MMPMDGQRTNCYADQSLTRSHGDNPVTLRLIAYGGERPTVAFGIVTPGSIKDAVLQLLNETDLDRVLVLEKLPSGISLVEENGLDPSLGTFSVPRRSSRVLRVSWSPDGAAALNDSLRWRMAEGLRKVRLEVRLQGTVAPELPALARSNRAAGTITAKAADLRVLGKQTSPSSVTLKAPPKTLSLARPSLVAATSGTVPLYTPRDNLQRRAAPMDPLAVNAPAMVTSKPSSAPSLASPQPVLVLSAWQAANTPPRVSSTAEQSRVLDFRRVGCTENKRERALISWMNSEVATLGTEASDIGSRAVEGHVVRRLMGEVTGKAYVYFKRNESFAAMVSKIESKIAAKQLTIRDAEHTLSDVRMRQQALDVLTSYHPFWLAVGLQTILGRALVFSQGNMLSLMRPGAEVPAFIRAHILEHFLADQELASQIRQAALKHDYWETLGARVLGRVLLMVLLLDRMVQRHDLPAGTPSLFRQDAKIKSSEQVVQEFLQPRLAGAGDVRHSLRMMAYHTEYVQHARDEADFRVHKPMDLRDGTRLAKLLDNLRRQDAVKNGNNSKPMISQYSDSAVCHDISRFGCVPPAACSSRTQAPDAELLPTMAFPQNTGKPMDESQMRNNCLRFVRFLQQQGIGLQGLAAGASACLRDSGLDGIAKYIAEGLLRVDQKITLGVLWQLAAHYKLRHHVDVRSLEREVARLRRATGQIVAEDGATSTSYFNDPISQTLLQWMRAACAPYGVSVDDFSWSLSDGRVLCYMVHAYMPELLPLSSITSPELPSSVDEMVCMTGGAEYVKLETLKAKGWTAVYEMGGAIHDESLAAVCKRSVDANFAAIHTAGEALGVPAMLSAEDYLNDGPDEMAAILYVALLGEALLRLTSERRAAYVIMEFLRRRLSWRPDYMNASLGRFKAAMQRSEAASTIQSFWRMRCQRCRYLTVWRAAKMLQAFVRRWIERQRLQKQMHAIVLLQSGWRRHAVRSRLWRQGRSATMIQAAWRGFTVRQALARMLHAALVIQRHVRTYLASNRCSHRRLVVAQANAAVKIQTAWRGYAVHRRFQQLRAAAVAIQAFVRMRQAFNRYHFMWRAAVTIQASWRMRQEQQSFQRYRWAAICLQRSWRRHMEVQYFMAACSKVVSIQACVRGFLARREASVRLQGVVQIQAAWRAQQGRCLAKRRMLELEKSTQNRAAMVLQAAVRGHLVRRQMTQYVRAAVIIQACWRMASMHHRHKAMRVATVNFQTAVRSWLVQRRLREQHRAAATVQRFWRSYLELHAIRAACTAATVMQTAWRARRERSRFLTVCRAAVHVQRSWRLRFQARAAISLQAYWRMVVARRRFIQNRAIIIMLQTRYRCLMAMQQLEGTKTAAKVTQQSWRCASARRKVARRVEAYYMDRLRREEERLLEIARHYMLSTAAAKRIQAWWRGLLVRKAFLPIWKRHKELARQQRAAVAIQSAWRAYSTRTKYRRVLHAVKIIASVLVPIFRARRELALLRSAHHARVRAAITIQKGVRRWLARWHFLQAVAAVIKIQAAWRGHMVRARNARPRLQDLRRRLEQAADEARGAPQRQLGHRTREALDVLHLPNKNLSQVLAALEIMEVSTRYSRDCCKLVTQNGGVAALLRFVKSCNRSKPYGDMLNRTLAVLHNVCRYQELIPEVYYAEDCLTVLSELAQYYRDAEEVFIPTVILLQRLTVTCDLAANIPSAILRHWEGIHQVLFRKADIERKYLERLEGQKGSDVSARESARKLVIVQQQILALEVLIGRACQALKDGGAPASDLASDQDKDEPLRRVGPGRAGPAVAAVSAQVALPMPGFKNTLVKNVVQRLANAGTGVSTVRGSAQSGAGAGGSPVQSSKSSRPFSRRTEP
ncbi:hypothetical protein VaNZ11_010395 [Volvox africanus]|uniref:Calponin-homology (CH) domain-containing protein n=1 Tax=Volvox africanus TaxID=51714 RepID=A0ABQ5S9C0_9CHLO|nr:hypothetical protein VaNZ11_010395 [Volvox africanus]